MLKLIMGCAVVLWLAGCANVPPAPVEANSPCVQNPASWDCQVEQYGKVNM